MTKPLCVILQLVGAGFLLFNIGTTIKDGIGFAIIFGLSLIIIGGIGTRINIKKQRKG